ncbi:hypothetical protein IB642_01570 [Allofrancisella guangzhouensis]|nr:hypothetical protein [Allofrancisella guangzhouensis]
MNVKFENMKEFNKKNYMPLLEKNYHNLLSNPINYYFMGVIVSLKVFCARNNFTFNESNIKIIKK